MLLLSAVLVAHFARWAARHGLSGRVALLVDHGSEPSAVHLPRLGVSVVFSGPRLSADDVAARRHIERMRILLAESILIGSDIAMCEDSGT